VFSNWYSFYFHKTFFVVDPDAARLRECPRRIIQALHETPLLMLSSSVSVSDIILLSLSEFHVNHVNSTACMVCYKLEELRSRYDAKLQHVFLTFSSRVFLQKRQNYAWVPIFAHYIIIKLFRFICAILLLHNFSCFCCWMCGLYWNKISVRALQNEKRIGWTNVGELENCVHFKIGKTY